MTPKEQIIKLLSEKSVLKQNIFHNTLEQFNQLKELLKASCEELKDQFGDKDHRVSFEFKDLGSFQCQIKVAGDLLIFQMHSNVFQIESSHSLWQTGYLNQNPDNSYVGVINVYNFLADSFRYDRSSDVGYLIARIFLNKENHFITQGKKQLGYLFNDFISSDFNPEQKQNFIDQIILYTLNFDLLVPPFENLEQITVEEMQGFNHSGGMATGKRLGFQFGIQPE
jgi:hypothetical protein